MLALTAESNQRPSSVRIVKYKLSPPAFDKAALRLAATFAEECHQGEAVARAADQLRRQHSYVPDVILGHLGWGETLFLKEVWPEARHVVYAELFYRSRGLSSAFWLPAIILTRALARHLEQQPAKLAQRWAAPM
jgi:hypothetical protein